MELFKVSFDGEVAILANSSEEALEKAKQYMSNGEFRYRALSVNPAAMYTGWSVYDWNDCPVNDSQSLHNHVFRDFPNWYVKFGVITRKDPLCELRLSRRDGLFYLNMYILVDSETHFVSYREDGCFGGPFYNESKEKLFSSREEAMKFADENLPCLANVTKVVHKGLASNNFRAIRVK